MTVPAAWFDWRACWLTVKPACWRVLVAVVTSSPVTSGTVTWAGAATTFRVTVSPFDTLAGGFGDWSSTEPGPKPNAGWTSWVATLSPSFCSVWVAGPTCWRTTFGTVKAAADPVDRSRRKRTTPSAASSNASTAT